MPKLTSDDLMALFQASVDPEFARMLLEQPDSGIEVVRASATVFAAASDAVEQTTQGFFLRPHSSQTYPPASGAALARVVLTLSRTAPADLAVVLDSSLFGAEEQAADSSDGGPVLVPTGRRYLPDATMVLMPGVSSLDVPFSAERPGDGYDLPLPGSISLLDDVGEVNDVGATVVPGTTGHRLVLAALGETVAPSALGQYVELVTGANAGQRRRIIGYSPPDPNAPHNGVLTLAPTLVLAVSAVSGSFVLGERVEQASTGAALSFLGVGNGYLAGDRLVSPAFVAGSIRGVQSGATATVATVVTGPDMAAESLTAGWHLHSWAGLGLFSSNAESPAGGRSPTLDFLGGEKKINRSSGEGDEQYRARVYARPDVVAPNALLRAMNRVLVQYGLEGCLREVSDLDTFPGFFYDAPASGPDSRRYAYDMDFGLRPQDRYKLYLDQAEFRGFFVAAVPPMNLGEFGFAYDEGFTNFYDSAPFLSFYDGFAATASTVLTAVWNALNGARGEGVGFDLVRDRFGCG